MNPSRCRNSQVGRPRGSTDTAKRYHLLASTGTPPGAHVRSCLGFLLPIMWEVNLSRVPVAQTRRERVGGAAASVGNHVVGGGLVEQKGAGRKPAGLCWRAVISSIPSDDCAVFHLRKGDENRRREVALRRKRLVS